MHVVGDTETRADHGLVDDQAVPVVAHAHVDVQVLDGRERVLHEQPKVLSDTVVGERERLASQQVGELLIVRIGRRHPEVLAYRVAIVLDAGLQAVLPGGVAERGVHPLVIERAVLRGGKRVPGQRVERRCRGAPVAEGIDGHRRPELPQPRHRLRVVAKTLRGVDPELLRLSTVRDVEVAAVHREHGADEVIVRRPEFQLPREPARVAGVVVVVDRGRVQIPLGAVRARADEIAHARRQAPTERPAAVDGAEATHVQAGRTRDPARVVEPGFRRDVHHRAQLAPVLGRDAAGHHRGRLHVARVERVRVRLRVLVGHRHTVDHVLNLTVRSTDVDAAVLARDEPRRGQQHSGELTARRRRRQPIDQVRAKVHVRSGG